MSTHYSETVFRAQAISALSRTPFGRPISIVPRPWLWLTGLVVLLALAAILFLATAEYSRKESVRGWLVSREGVARITHNAAGTVRRIAAAPGDTVQAGDPLMYLSQETFLEDGRSSSDQVLLELQKQIAALERRIQLLRDEAAIEQRSVAMRLQVVEKERRAIVQQRVEQQSRVNAASDKLLRLKSAAKKGAVTDWDVMRQEDEISTLQQTLGQSQLSDIALQHDRERLTAQARRLPVETERSVSSLRSQQSQLQQQLTEYESGRRIVLKSPISGILASVEVYPGGAVAPHQLLATVLPENLTLVAEVYVPSSAIGFIQPGQNVRLMYDAFPLQQFGAFAGQVESISSFVLLPSEVPQTFFLREATFKVRIALASDSITLEAGRATLRPGMLLAAEIILENRNLIDWLLEPALLRRRDAV